MTIRRYFTDPSRRGSATVVEVGSDDRGPYVILDETLFHPQGGGQPADTGALDNVAVTHVAASPDHVRHYVESADALETGQSVSLEIDDGRRTLHERLHTAGHLIGSIVELMFPQAEAASGHHWPGESRVDFRLSVDTLDADSIRFILEPELRRAISHGPAVYASENTPGARMVVIEGHRPIPCGGTHVRNVAELVEILFRGVKIKKNILRIGYDVASLDDITGQI